MNGRSQSRLVSTLQGTRSREIDGTKRLQSDSEGSAIPRQARPNLNPAFLIVLGVSERVRSERDMLGLQAGREGFTAVSLKILRDRGFFHARALTNY
jgi:hypothetical protein